VVRSSARDNRVCTVIVIDDELVLHLDEHLAATWEPNRRSKVFTVARVAAGTSAPQTDDETPPDPAHDVPQTACPPKSDRPRNGATRRQARVLSRASGRQAHAAA
jgi:hypothetical protein